MFAENNVPLHARVPHANGNHHGRVAIGNGHGNGRYHGNAGAVNDRRHSREETEKCVLPFSTICFIFIYFFLGYKKCFSILMGCARIKKDVQE